MHLARQDGAAAGFVVLIPGAERIELRYLGVDPDAWGRGVGSRLLGYVADQARANGFAAADLWVLLDNERAIQAYARAGWSGTGDLKCQLPSRLVETRLELRLI